MHKQLRRVATAGAILAFLTIMPGLAWALGLGQIQSDTHIGQPLKARIPILVDNANDLQGLKVGLAEPSAYQQAGLRQSDYLFTLDFQVKHGARGAYVLVTSSQPVKLPFLNLLIRARWASGQVTRRYTLLLNPPVFASKGQQGGTQTQPVVSEPSASQRSQSASSRPQSAARTNRPQGSPTHPQTPTVRTRTLQAHTYGPVRHGDTLWGIANRMHSGTGLSVNQMMIAIYRANPQAFSGNINRLKSGVELRVPSQKDIAGISRRAATSEVVSQNRSWQSAKTSFGSEEVATQPSNGSVSGQRQSAPQGNEATTAQQNAGGENTSETIGGGEVVLTAPTVAESPAGATAGERTAANAMAGSVATAAAAGMAAGGAQGRLSNEQGKPSPNAPVAVASSGGPLKSSNAELAALASQATSQGGQAANASGNENSSATTPDEHKSGATNPANTVNTANTTGANASNGPVMDWLTSPKGWIVIILIIILLVLIAYFLIRRRQGQTDVTAAERANAEAHETDEAGYSEEEAAALETGIAHEEYPTEEGANEWTAQAGDATPDEAAAVEAHSEAGTSDQVDEAALADALVEADFYAGSGDHAGAAASLAVALEHAPERNDLRLRRLEELHASGERDAFLTEAEGLHGQVPEDSADWQAVAVMGRQLLPDEALFREEGEPVVPDAAETTDDEEAPLDVDRELDRLTQTESSHGLQDDFERTLGELSTMIETYMPEDDAAPDELQSSPSGEAAEIPPSMLEKETRPPADEDDDVLEFEPQILPEQASGAAGHDTENELVHDKDVSGDGEAAHAPPSDDASIDLELAHSYIDMGDAESARGVLEDVLANGDPAASDQARQLLDNLETGDASTPLAFTDEQHETTTIDSDVPMEADDEAADGQTTAESGTMLDLARAYVEMGDRESARDVLEEILDKGDAAETEQARELLDTL